jgi:hypothetical protein
MGEYFYREYLRSKDPRTLPDVLREWAIQIVLVPFNDIPVWFHHLDRAPDWRWVYRDDRHAVFVHASVASGVASLRPPVDGEDYPSFPAERTDAILDEAAARRMPSLPASVLRRHYEPQRELWWSLLYLRSGRPEAAIGFGLAGLEQATFPAPEIFATLGHAFFDKGDRVRAERCFRVALEHVDDPLARRRWESLTRSSVTNPSTKGARDR